MSKSKEISFWPYMILGFLAIGITLSYWTIKSASSMPVQESNTYMMKYQATDRFIHKIMAEQKAFDAKYKISLGDVDLTNVNNNIHARSVVEDIVKLNKGSNKFSYEVLDTNNNVVQAKDVKFILTQPHSRKNDSDILTIDFKDGKYIASIDILNPGRYTLQLRVAIDDNIVGFSETPAYLEP